MRESKAIEFRGDAAGEVHTILSLYCTAHPLLYFALFPLPAYPFKEGGAPIHPWATPLGECIEIEASLCHYALMMRNKLLIRFFPFSIDRGKRNKAPVTPLKYSNCLLIYSALRYRAIKFISYFTIALKCSLLPVIVKNEIDIHFILDLDK